jgi:LysM repeat protein
MNSEHLDSPRRSGYSTAILAIAALVILGLAALLIFRPWAPGDDERLALVIRSTETATRVPSVTATRANSPTPGPTAAASTHTPAPSATPSPQPVTHEIKAGDTLGAIAKIYGVSVGDITDANQIATDDVLKIGQVLIIPVTGDAGAAAGPTGVTPATTVQPSTPIVENVTYEIQAGDTLGAIAKAYGVTVAAITEANQIETDDVLRVGQMLIIPRERAAETAEASPTPANTPSTESTENADSEREVVVYEIQAGDVLSTIAKQFDVSMNAIIEENALEDPERLSIGQELRIPLGTPTPPPTATTLPTPTPTSGPPLPAPILLGPVQGETITDPSALLNWSSVAILGVEEWYLVQLWNGEAPDGIFVAEEWTQTTSWRAPADIWQAEGVESPLFYWSVIVAHRLKGENDAGWSWEALSSESEVRSFTWILDNGAD